LVVNCDFLLGLEVKVEAGLFQLSSFGCCDPAVLDLVQIVQVHVEVLVLLEEGLGVGDVVLDCGLTKPSGGRFKLLRQILGEPDHGGLVVALPTATISVPGAAHAVDDAVDIPDALERVREAAPLKSLFSFRCLATKIDRRKERAKKTASGQRNLFRNRL
jgi:hypothetical protein